MRARVSRGLSLTELIIAFVLVLLLLLYTISSFVSSHRYIVRGKEYATALFLAQTQMEMLHATPISDIQEIGPGVARFEPPFENYFYDVSLNDWDGDLKQLDVNVTSPRGAIARIKTLRQLQSFQGVIADPATNRLVYTVPGSNLLHYYDDAPGKPGTLSAALPNGGVPGGLAGDPGWNLLWAVNTTDNSIVPYREQNPGPWGTPIEIPKVSEELASPRIAGISMDIMGNIVYIADWSNRGLWVYLDGVPGMKNGTKTGLYRDELHAPVQPPLGIPSGVTTDPTGSLVVVADTENQCLRKLFVNLGNPSARPEGYKSEELEFAPGLGYWLKERLRHDKGMGAPQGVVLNSSGWAVYTIDRAYLYRMIEQTPGEYDWKRWELPKELADQGPSGLAYDEFDNLIYVTTKNGGLWKHKVATPEWKELTSGPAGP
jgi:DNA-binding beta-propeller fold protein YncE